MPTHVILTKVSIKQAPSHNWEGQITQYMYSRAHIAGDIYVWSTCIYCMKCLWGHVLWMVAIYHSNKRFNTLTSKWCHNLWRCWNFEPVNVLVVSVHVHTFQQIWEIMYFKKILCSGIQERIRVYNYVHNKIIVALKKKKTNGRDIRVHTCIQSTENEYTHC